MRDHTQLEHRVGLPWTATQLTGFGVEFQQPEVAERADGGLQALAELLLAPRQEQFVPDERIQQASKPHHAGATHAAVVLEAAGDPGRGSKQVQQVVAEVALHHGAVGSKADHVAERMRRAHQHVHLLAVGDDLLR